MALRWNPGPVRVPAEENNSGSAFKDFGAASKHQARGGNSVRPKILIAGAVILAFVLGTMANGIYSSTARAFNPVNDNAVSSARIYSYPAAHTHFVQPRTVYVSDSTPTAAPVYQPAAPVYQSYKKRSFGKEALIVGGSAGAGAAIGALAGGGKGAGIGALSGGIAGLVYDLATRNK